MTTDASVRWLQSAEPWANYGNWDPTEYLQWVKRLNEARASLEKAFLEVDGDLLKTATAMAQKQDAHVKQSRPTNNFSNYFPGDTAQVIVRYIIAYHFFARARFEEIPDKALVKRIQVHFSSLDIGILDADVAQMLQYAADKVSLFYWRIKAAFNKS